MTYNNNTHTIIGDKEILSFLPSNKQAYFVLLDATFGLGLHSKCILNHYPNAIIHAFDYDKNNIEKFWLCNMKYRTRLFLYHMNFIYSYKVMKIKAIKIDYILVDFGVHTEQIFTPTLGLSYCDYDTKLNMLVDNTCCACNASNVVNTLCFNDLSNIFYYLGDIKNSKVLASLIVEWRRETSIKTNADLINIINQVSTSYQYKAKVFQALRIYVNKEIQNIYIFLCNIWRFCDSTHGLTFISLTFHSLEDRILKNFVKQRPISYGMEKLVSFLNIDCKPCNVVCYNEKKIVNKGYINRRKKFFFLIRRVDIKLS